MSLVVLVVLVALLLGGHSGAAQAFLVVVIGHGLYSLGQIRQADKAQKAYDAATALPDPGAPAQTLRKSESLTLRHSAEDVWALIVPAENAPALNPNVVKAFTVPGTPLQGVGQQQCFVTDKGETSIVEVVEYEHERRAVTRVVSPPMPVEVRSLYKLEPLETGCVLTFETECDVPSGGHRWTREQEMHIAALLVDFLDRVNGNLSVGKESD